MSIFVQSAAAALAEAVKLAGLWTAWGNGSVGWDLVSVTEDVSATALLAEIGRRRANVIEHVEADPLGDIIVPQGTFAVAPAPTGILYVRTNFANTEAVGQDIREAAVFAGTTLIPGLPVGQQYFLPADIADPGVMMMIEHFPKVTRTSAFSVSLEYVLTL